jgi:hypothetical protein
LALETRYEQKNKLLASSLTFELQVFSTFAEQIEYARRLVLATVGLLFLLYLLDVSDWRTPPNKRPSRFHSLRCTDEQINIVIGLSGASIGFSSRASRIHRIVPFLCQGEQKLLDSRSDPHPSAAFYLSLCVFWYNVTCFWFRFTRLRLCACSWVFHSYAFTWSTNAVMQTSPSTRQRHTCISVTWAALCSSLELWRSFHGLCGCFGMVIGGTGTPSKTGRKKVKLARFTLMLTCLA